LQLVRSEVSERHPRVLFATGGGLGFFKEIDVGGSKEVTHEGGRRGVFAAFRETLLAFTFDIGGLVAGFLVAVQLGIFQLSPWAIAVYPAILGAKGVLQGLLTRRLGTALHLGTVYPRFLNNTKSFYKLLSAIIVTTLVVSFVMSLVSLVFGVLFWGVTPGDFLGIVLVVVASMSLGLVLSIVTVQVGFVTFKRGLDPDIIVYPIMSTVADIFVTVCFVLVLDIFFLVNVIGTYVVGAIIASHLLLALFVLSKYAGEEPFRRNLKESIPTLLLVSLIANVTGTVLKNISALVDIRKEVYTAYPALGDTVGDVGSIVGFTATTRLALGLLRPSLSSIVHHAKTIVSTWGASVVVFVVIALLSPIINGIFSFPAFINLLTVLLLANVLAVFATVLLSYGLSIVAFQKSLDPDNVVIPLQSTLADTLVTVALLIALIIVR
jgi:mgtE-like transporter